jgi:hypothetical protein
VITIENMNKGAENHFRVGLTSIKIVTGWNTYDYALGWTVQIDTPNPLPAGSSWQVWFSPIWAGQSRISFICHSSPNTATTLTENSLHLSSPDEQTLITDSSARFERFASE